MPDSLAMLAVVLVFYGVCVWALFWVIRLAVRYGTNDALRMNRDWLAARDPEREHRP